MSPKQRPRTPPVAQPAAPEADADVFRRLASGDISAMGTLYDRYALDVRTFARRAAGPGGDAEDIAHEAFLTAVRIAGTYDGRTSARALLIGITANLVRRRRSALARFARLLADFGATGRAVDHRMAGDALAEKEDLQLFDRALAKLSDEKRLVLLMVDGQGLSGDEAATALGIPTATVRTRLHYARREVRTLLQRWGAP